MDIHSQTALLAALITAGVAIGVALREGDRRLAILFVFFAGNVGLWHIGDFWISLTENWLFVRFRIVVACAIPLTTHQFFHAFLSSQTAGLEVDQNASSSRALGRTLAFGFLLGGLFALTPLVNYPVARGLVLAYVFLALSAVLWQIHVRRAATPSRIERGRLAYLVMGGMAAAGFALAGFIPGVSPIVPSVGKAVVVLYLYVLSQAILRHRLLDLNELLAKLVVLSALAIVLSFVYGAIVLWAGDDPALIVFNVLLLSFALMTLFEPLRARFEHHVMGIVFSERVLLKRVLDGLRAEIPGIIDPVLCAQHILERIYETGRATHASVYLLSENGTGFKRVGHRGPEPPPWLDTTAVREVLRAADAGQKAVLRETVERGLLQSRTAIAENDGEEAENPESGELARLRGLRESLEKLSSGVLVPLIGGGRVVGLLSLYDERVYEAFSTNEIGALIVVGDLTATVVDNSRLYERMKERDRLAALGEMAAGLAHEIRNPLGAIKAAAQYLRPSETSPSPLSREPSAGDSVEHCSEPRPPDPAEFLQIIVEEVDRLDGVVGQFLDYARPLKAAFARTDLREMVRRTVRLLEQRDISDDVDLVLRLDGDLPEVNADSEQIRQVLINLTLNAVQAMEGRGRLVITTGFEQADPDSGVPESWVHISVRDDGPGIPDDVRAHLFIPFFTTKDRGTGLGLPICQRIIENHGGRIEVHSSPGRGSEFRIALPVADDALLGIDEQPARPAESTG